MRGGHVVEVEDPVHGRVKPPVWSPRRMRTVSHTIPWTVTYGIQIAAPVTASMPSGRATSADAGTTASSA